MGASRRAESQTAGRRVDDSSESRSTTAQSDSDGLGLADSVVTMRRAGDPGGTQRVPKPRAGAVGMVPPGDSCAGGSESKTQRRGWLRLPSRAPGAAELVSGRVKWTPAWRT